MDPDVVKVEDTADARRPFDSLRVRLSSATPNPQQHG
jgi:hypothetical protein